MFKYLLLTSFLISLPLFSETVLFKDGSNKKGKVVGQDRENIQLKLSDESVVSIPKSKILKVIYREVTDKEALDIYKKEIKKDTKVTSLEPPMEKENELPEKKPLTENPPGTVIDPQFMEGIRAQNEQILLLTDEIMSLSKQVEEQKAKIEKLEKYNFGDGPKIIRWEVVKRSAMFPGWGQFYWNEPVWGSLYASLFVASLVNYNQTWSAFQKEQAKYQDFTLEYLSASNGALPLIFAPPISDKSKKYQKAANATNNAAYAAVAIYLINMIDAFLYRHDKSIAYINEGDTPIRSGLEFKTEVQPSTLNAGGVMENNSIYKLEYTWRF